MTSSPSVKHYFGYFKDIAFSLFKSLWACMCVAKNN